MSIGVIGNTSDFGSEESRFEPLMDNEYADIELNDTSFTRSKGVMISVF